MPRSFRGTNVAGGYVQWQEGVTPVEGTNYQWVSTDDIDYLATRVGFIRLLFSWELLQPAAGGPFDPAYHAKMQSLVTYATSKDLNVLIEPHGEVDTGFARYKGHLVGSPEVPNAIFADLWQRLALAYGGNAQVMFGLSNEPNNMSTMQWFSAAQAAIAAIRGAGAASLIFVPGNGYSQPAAWNDTYYDTAALQVSNAKAWRDTLSDPLDRLVVSVHTYFDSSGGGLNQDEIVSTTIIRDRLEPVVEWARPLGLQVHLSEFGCNKSTPNALAAVSDAIAFMDANCDVMLGWAWWTYGPRDWWGDYAFTLSYDHIDPMGIKVDDVKMTWLSPHAGVTALPHITDTGLQQNHMGTSWRRIWRRATRR
jgi:endoglucanase